MSKSPSKTSLNRVQQQQQSSQQRLDQQIDSNIYEYLDDDFTDEDEPTPQPPQQPKKLQTETKKNVQTPRAVTVQPTRKLAPPIKSSTPSPTPSRASRTSRTSRTSQMSARTSTSLSSKQPSSRTSRSGGGGGGGGGKDRMDRPILIYSRVQGTLIFICLVMSLAQLGLAMWLHIDPQFRFLAALGNSLAYASVDRLFGLYPYAALAFSALALLLDLVELAQFVFIKSYLRTKEAERVTRYRYTQLQQLIMYIKTYTLMTHLFYIFIVISIQLFVASYLIVNFQLIINYQIPQTLIKLLREYEKRTSNKEIELVKTMHKEFECCHYQNPYQFGDLTPPECNLSQGCLRPIQELTWAYLYASIALALAFGVIKLAIQVLLILNFYWLLLNRIIRSLNDQKQIELARMVIDDDNNDDDDKSSVGANRDYNDDNSSWTSDEDHVKRAEGDRKLAEIRRAKEERLEREERAEEARRQREAEEEQRKLEYERRQDEYEMMLFKQKRYDELRVEQMKRRLNQQQQKIENSLFS